MSILNMRLTPSRWTACLVTAAAVLLTSCGGGGSGGSNQSAGVGGTGIVAGKTTGFGSIFVNGGKYETGTSQFIVDGEVYPDQLAANLQLGMYVKLRVKTLDGNFTNEALEVFYDDEVQGPVTGILPVICPCPGETQRIFTVYGQNITIDETTTIFNKTTFDDLEDNRVVEISGFRTAPDAITATYVEDKGPLVDGSEVELRGIVTGYTPGVPESFGIVTAPGITIEVGGAIVRDPPDLVLKDDLYVEVEATYDELDPSTVQATEIEEEEEVFGNYVDDVSLQGVISNYDQATGDFEIDGLPIDVSQATELSPANVLDLIDDGVEIEVEGDIVDGTLIADELELREGDSELRTTVGLIELGSNRFQLEYPGQPTGSGLGTIWINLDSQTLFEDESAADEPKMTLDLLVTDDLVRVKGIANSGQVDAEIVKRLDPPESTKIRGVVEAKNPPGTLTPPVSITILGITYPVELVGPVSYEDASGNPMSEADFFDAIVVGTSVVELEDDDPADGDFDSAEFDD